MNDLTIFNYTGRQVRTMVIDGEPWFVAKDVCEILGIDTSNLSKTLDADERDTYAVDYTDQVRNVSIVSEKQRESVIVDALGGEQEMTAISEAGVYKLVFASRKPGCVQSAVKYINNNNNSVNKS